MALFSSRTSLTQLPRFALSASSVQILQQASQYRSTLLSLIASAERRIYLCSLYLQHDEAGEEILHALHAAKAARPQLDIVVLVDWHRAQRGLIGAAKTPGKVAGNAAWYQQQCQIHATEVPVYGVPVQTRELFGVLHLKGFVIDDTVIYSGASINNVYLHKLDKYRHDRYLLLTNPALADAMQQFLRDHLLNSAAVLRLDQEQIPDTRSIWQSIRQFRAQLKKAHYALPLQDASLQQLSVTPLVGVGKNNPLNRVLCQLLAASRERIMICTPYFNFPRAISREISRALKRGVVIDIIVGDKTANDFYIPPEQPFKAIGALPYLYEVNLRRFAKKQHRHIESGQLNLHLWRDADNSYHLKGIWVDQHYTLMTGNNLNPRAFRLDLENALLIHDPQHELTSLRQSEQDSIMRDTTRIGHFSWLEQVSDYPPEVAKLLKRLSRTRLDRLFYRVL
ncbi:MAG: CDP-diacylglycerol--serine O-phosphatidyltransferase [Pseudomonadota bacterium]|jgi:CDP-diacylglycerol--serine O-phosphatidyltransferase